MYIRLLLLMTLVMSNTPITDVNIDVMEQMDSLMEFNDKTQHVFNNGKKIFEIVKDFMEEAEKNILEMRSEIDHIEYGELHAKDISRISPGKVVSGESPPGTDQARSQNGYRCGRYDHYSRRIG